MSQNHVLLLGLDFGSTTCSGLIVSAAMASEGTSGTAKFSAPQIIYRATPVFTPFLDGGIDAEKISSLIRTWLTESQIKTTELFAASAIITGLAAQQDNVKAIRSLIATHIPNAAIIAADDPHLESWLAFMGSCAALSCYHDKIPILNLDIGGGTTNAALGEAGNVQATGCHFIGARHFQFVPGGYQLQAVSPYGEALLEHFAIKKTLGNTLNEEEIAQLIAFYAQALEAIVQNNQTFFGSPIAAMHLQAAWNMAPKENIISSDAKITFSGGVGEIVYQLAAGGSPPSTTFYGDFGIDLAQAIVSSPVLSANLKTHVPENLGRATVTGLALNSTEVSGSSIYLASANSLPLRDIPILAKLPFDAPIAAWQQALAEASKRVNGACLQITHQYLPSLQQIRNFAKMLSAEILHLNLLNPLILLIEGNFGKTLGNYISHWGKLSLKLIVIDEVAMRDAHFVNLGKMQQGLVPVSFYGMY